ncbi:isomerase [Veronia nyctiphanis]|uniref:Isomerase n=1 Tax=Veronia nyctiphanis TaxID=1278244 RepID=A0A4Q0YSP9_9GAMM|nr:PhzF family phenazine biosynthesis protein [Veronia nyctiphanis]RXJ74196.1 isomerase [Veronia nyctiphanis]
MTTCNVFVSDVAAGNPCGVVQLDSWLPDSDLLRITKDIGLPVTSFVKQCDGKLYIRWFSLHSEINLCGHGSLGAGAVILSRCDFHEVTFDSQYGQVCIFRQADSFAITLPTWKAKPSSLHRALADTVSDVVEVFHTRDLVLVLPSVDDVRQFSPAPETLLQIPNHHAIIVTAKQGDCGYVLRYFAPKIGIDEDIATGSAQCSLAPYWFEKLGKTKLEVTQLSPTGGYFQVQKASKKTITVMANVSFRDSVSQ